MSSWPKQSYDEMTRFYGEPGTNCPLLYVPKGYPMIIAWDKERVLTRFACNKKIHEPVTRVLTKTLEHYKQEGIKKLGLHLFGGCLNVRKMRGGSSWSIHSWGAAIDFDPEKNQLKWGKDRAQFAKPEYDEWWKFWEAEGGVSLGRARNYDWMHVQFARL